ncbi:chaperone NapD [Calditerrivibrio sp.]|jgi:nitrate reductase NapAB chaperone NapD
MILVGSVVTCLKDSTNSVAEVLKDYPNIDIHAIDEKKSNILITIEEESDFKLEELCKKLQEHPFIVQISHHYFNFEEEVDKIEKGIPTDLSLKGFSKSEQRKERDILSEY